MRPGEAPNISQSLEYCLRQQSRESPPENDPSIAVDANATVLHVQVQLGEGGGSA